MHTFQPIPVDMLDMNPFTKIGKEWALLTAGNKQESNTMTISWGGVSDQYRDALNYCGSHSGRNEDKIANAGLTVDYRHGIPYIDEGNLVLVCEKMSATRITDDSFLDSEIADKWYKDGDMHTMYVAEIIDILAR